MPTRLFISYSRVDRDITERLVERLRRLYGLPNVWYDDELHGGDRWWRTILENIAECDVFIYLLSNESVTSPYCQAEFTEARRLQKPIVTVQVRDRTKLAGELSEIQYVDMRLGMNDDSLARLGGSINRQADVPKRNRALWTPQTALPHMPDDDAESSAALPERDTPTLRIERPTSSANKGSGGIMHYVAAILALVVVIAAAAFILPRLQPDANAPTPTPTVTHTQAVVAVSTTSETLTVTETAFASPQPSETPSPQLTNTPTLSTQQVGLLITAEMATIVIGATLTGDAINAATSAALTLTADTWTDVPTPNFRETAEAQVTRDAIAAATQGVINVTRTADAWTDTPTFTPKFTPTTDPMIAALDRARNFTGDENTDWEPFATTFPDDPAAAPMVLVPVGSFQMGSPEGVGEEDEHPIHTQTFDQPFWIDQTEVTRGQWNLCVEAGACPAKTTNQYSSRNNQPVNNVTWFQAQAYCAWRGDHYRLPQEREWEYAARGVQSWTYPWGNNTPTTDLAVYDASPGDETFDVGVDQRRAGASWVGALDMSGNLWEWVNSLVMPYQDVYNPDDGREADTGNRTDVVRVLRGVSFYNDTADLRGAYRYGFNPDIVDGGRGFRCLSSYNPDLLIS